MDKQNWNTLIDPESELVVAEGRRVGGLGGRGKAIRKYRWVVME